MYRVFCCITFTILQASQIPERVLLVLTVNNRFSICFIQMVTLQCQRFACVYHHVTANMYKEMYAAHPLLSNTIPTTEAKFPAAQQSIFRLSIIILLMFSAMICGDDQNAA